MGGEGEWVFIHLPGAYADACHSFCAVVLLRCVEAVQLGYSLLSFLGVVVILA